MRFCIEQYCFTSVQSSAPSALTGTVCGHKALCVELAVVVCIYMSAG